MKYIFLYLYQNGSILNDWNNPHTFGSYISSNCDLMSLPRFSASILLGQSLSLNLYIFMVFISNFGNA